MLCTVAECHPAECGWCAGDCWRVGGRSDSPPPPRQEELRQACESAGKADWALAAERIRHPVRPGGAAVARPAGVRARPAPGSLYLRAGLFATESVFAAVDVRRATFRSA